MITTIEIVDRGRGPQLSSSRITVQDVVPLLRRNLTHEQILEAVPDLTADELRVIERYVAENYDGVMEQDRHIRARAAQRRNPPNIEAILERGGEKLEALRKKFKENKLPERNGDNAAG